jgi:hypothetical protein
MVKMIVPLNRLLLDKWFLRGAAMKTFLQYFGAFVLGVVCGFDRIRFKGSKRKLAYLDGIARFCFGNQIQYKSFVTYAKDITSTLTRALESPAKEAGIYRYLNSSLVRPEQVALEIAAQHPPTPGLIAVLGRVEPCKIIVMRGKKGLLEPRIEVGKCLHYYHYYWDEDFGLRYTRLQTWFPFTMHIGINGRDWLGQQLLKAGIAHTKKDNCFTWIEDFAAAQKLADDQLKTNWSKLLEGWARQSNPLEPTLFKEGVPYYWTAQEAEYATDFAFRSSEDLQRFYPAMVHHAYATLQSGDLLRFMNYKVRSSGKPWEKVLGEIKTTIKESVQGTCVRHRVIGNLLKMYDKQESVLRLETLISNTLHFRVFRTPEGADNNEPMRYLRMRKGVADMHRRAEVSQKINERYAASLATVEETRPLGELLKNLTQRTHAKGRSVRALNPLAQDDAAVLEAVSRGEFLIHGFRNRDLQAVLYGPSEEVRQRSRAAKITRLLGILRAHGLIAKVSKTHRYQLTEKGRISISALLAARHANTKKLLEAA